MNPALPDQSRRLSAEELGNIEAAISNVAAQLSPVQLTKLLQGITWAEFQVFLRDTCPDVQGLPDSELDIVFQAFQRIVGEHLAVASRGHWTAGTA